MNRSILLADDDEGVRQLLGRTLQAEGYDVFFAQTAREASHAFLRQSPDLVLLDLSLPDKDGWEAFHLMKLLRPWTPIIIITGMPSQFAHASRLGAAGLMEKPFDLPVLFQAVKQMLDKCYRERVERQMEELYDEVPHSRPPCCLLKPERDRSCGIDHFATR